MDSAIVTGAPAKLSWIETFIGVLLAPQQTFRQMVETDNGEISGVGGAAITVALVNALDALQATDAGHLQWAVFNIAVSVFAGILMWLCLAGLISVLASCFNAGDRARMIFVTTGWSYAPWIIMMPLLCYKPLLSHAFVMVAFIPLCWMFVVQVIAIAETLKLKSWQAIAFIFVAPLLFQIFNFLQFLSTAGVLLSAFKL